MCRMKERVNTEPKIFLPAGDWKKPGCEVETFAVEREATVAMSHFLDVKDAGDFWGPMEGKHVWPDLMRPAQKCCPWEEGT